MTTFIVRKEVFGIWVWDKEERSGGTVDWPCMSMNSQGFNNFQFIKWKSEVDKGGQNPPPRNLADQLTLHLWKLCAVSLQSTVPPLRSSLATAEIPCWLRLLIYFNVVRRAFKQRLNIAHKMELGTKTCQFFFLLIPWFVVWRSEVGLCKVNVCWKKYPIS